MHTSTSLPNSISNGQANHFRKYVQAQCGAAPSSRSLEKDTTPNRPLGCSSRNTVSRCCKFDKKICSNAVAFALKLSTVNKLRST
mmetsp:Transcript_5126/g.7574  ORF Transcript_5126/g.7574 Transcript_5126/m.7574 type:complete len:85 (+) Transcript_5126:177-431(+)